jgi:DNA-binding NarL/FixJ family response regulator
MQNFDLRTRTKTNRPISVNVSVLAIVGSSRRRAVSLHVLRDRTVSSRSVLAQPEPLRTSALAPGAERAPLTRRELEVLRLLAAGMNTKRLAETLRVTRATVRNHVQSILHKLGVHSRLAAVVFAHSHRLV